MSLYYNHQLLTKINVISKMAIRKNHHNVTVKIYLDLASPAFFDSENASYLLIFLWKLNAYIILIAKSIN